MSNTQHTLNAIRISQRNAGEAEVIANLERMGLIPKQPTELDLVKARRDELVDALDHIEKTITRQLELIADRARGDYLDKRLVVQSLQSHARRARAAIAKATGEQA